MKEPHPQTRAAASRKEAQLARTAAGPTSRMDLQLKVRFYCSMKPQRVYPLTVELQPGPRNPAGSPNTPVVIRPVVPGAVVTPAEEKLDAAQPGAQAAFQVTPLARGRLRDARVEVRQQGYLVDQVRLRMKATTQRRTWILLFLTLLLPWLLVMVTHHSYYMLKATGRELGLKDDPERARAPGEVLDHKLSNFANVFLPKITELREYVVNPVIRGLRVAYDWACHLADDHLPFWIGVGLLGLTILSWIARRNQRTSRRKSLQLTTIIPLAEAAETLPLSPREQGPLAVQPTEG